MQLQADKLIRMALEEDITSEDVSTNAVMPTKVQGTVDLIAKEDGVIAGMDVYARVFKLLDEDTEIEMFCHDGDEVREGDLMAKVTGDIRVLLSGFCHTVIFHAVPTVLLKIHVAIQLIDGFIIQPRRFLQSLLTVTVGTFYDALVVVQISQEFTGSAQGIRPLGVQHGNVGQNHPVLLPDVLQGFGKVVILLHGGAIRITDQFPNVW